MGPCCERSHVATAAQRGSSVLLSAQRAVLARTDSCSLLRVRGAAFYIQKKEEANTRNHTLLKVRHRTCAACRL